MRLQSKIQNHNSQPKVRLLLLVPALVLFTGCQVLTYSSPQGEHFTRSSLGTKTSIQSLRVDSDTNGVRSVKLEGYQNDSTQALGAVTEAAVRAALQGVKP
jgi:hypothetical protein